MDLPQLDTATLARLRMQECQGTLIGGMVVAGSLGMEPEEFGYQMMVRQRIRWDSLAGNLDKIARIFADMANICEIRGDNLFKVRALRNLKAMV